jgi:twitching motility two-component system response regulator PilH
MSEERILVVDDSPTDLKIMCEPFSSKGYEVITAVDGEEALEKAESEKPTLMVLDVIMPKMNGFQVCRKIKTTPDLKGIKVLLLTSKNQESDEFWGMKQGADAYMTKPFEAHELLAKAEDLL